jgi:sugar transferase EpsL
MKRLFDTLLILLMSPIVIPLFFLIAMLVWFDLGSPIFMKQFRPGLNGKLFQIVKFRTMTNQKNGNGKLLSDGERLTRFGKFLRSVSLDELPGLWIVIKGDMSIVGPRPLLEEYLPLYNEFQARRHNVKPGITGWAQINGRNNLSWEKKFEYDIWYVDNQSFFLDVKIIFFTIYKVFIREGISAPGEPTMKKFTGTKNE